MSRKASLGSIYLVAFIDMLGFGTIIPVIRDFTILLADNSGYSAEWYALYSGALMSAYSLFQFIFSPLLGRLSDKYGRRPILMISVAGNVASYFIWAISHSFELFLISRILSGATGANISVAQSYIADVTDKSSRAKAMGLMGALFGLGFILGPFLGGILSTIDLSSIKLWVFSFNRFSIIGLFTMALSLINLIWIWGALKEPDRDLSAFAKKQQFLNPMVLFKQFKHGNLGALFLIYFLISIGFIHFEATLAWDLRDRFGLDAEDTGYFFAYVGVLLVVVQGGIYRGIIKRFGERRLVQAGLIFTAVGLAVLPWSSPLWVLGITIAVLAVGMGIGNPSITALASLNTNEQDQGMVLGINQAFGSLARVFSPAVATLMYDSVNTQLPFLSAAVFALIAFLISSKLPKKDSLND